MKCLKSIVLLYFFANSVIAQKPIKNAISKPVINEFAAIDNKVLQLPDSLTLSTASISNYITSNFKTEKEKVRAIFVWIASNIEYDYENLYTLNFHESLSDKINKPLKTRKGICENYASLFTDICQKCGIKSYVITGYTKQQGAVDRIPHAWCSAFVDNSWSMFDPTWGSGYIKTRKENGYINNPYYNTSPTSLIESHMPFDYMWQFLNYPIDRQAFALGKTVQDKTKPYFNFVDSIQAYEAMDSTDKLIATASRIERNGKMISIVFEQYEYIRLWIENKKQNNVVDVCNAANANANQAISEFNDFINFRNHQFKPAKSDTEIQGMLTTVKLYLDSARTKLQSVKEPSAESRMYIAQLTKSISDLEANLIEQQSWLTKYLSKGKLVRRLMF